MILILLTILPAMATCCARSATSKQDLSNQTDDIFVNGEVVFKEPFKIFQWWFDEAKNSENHINPSIMCFSTATKSGIPAGRFMLCTEFSKNGFKFFTDYGSRKGQELVRVEGSVEKLPFTEADKFFEERPYEQQIDAVTSGQGRVVQGQYVLAKKATEMRQKYSPGSVPKPELLGGYLLKPERMEFYQSIKGKMQERLQFRKPAVQEVADNEFVHEGEDGWIYEILAP